MVFGEDDLTNLNPVVNRELCPVAEKGLTCCHTTGCVKKQNASTLIEFSFQVTLDACLTGFPEILTLLQIRSEEAKKTPENLHLY